jgi:hypothetical protein
MKSDFWLEQIPLWGVFCLSVAMVLFSIFVGTVLGQRRRRKPKHETEASLGPIISSTLGLLAFMLAFTFGITAERFQTKRQLLLDEVNAISTTYLRAGLLLEPHRSQLRNLLREYVDIRASVDKESGQKQVQKIQEMISRSELLLDRMWPHAIALADADRSSEIDALFINSLNEMIDLHTSRLTVFNYRVPPTIWHILFFITILSMLTVGYQAGLLDKKVLKIGIILALAFSSVVLLIADLDRGAEGSLRLSQQPMIELQKKMQLSAEKVSPEEKTETHAEK